VDRIVVWSITVTQCGCWMQFAAKWRSNASIPNAATLSGRF
jgi:hypothetical protein